ncbi:hypothetical protein ACLB2K_020068 [Fragaria x ananassa]
MVFYFRGWFAEFFDKFSLEVVPEFGSDDPTVADSSAVYAFDAMCYWGSAPSICEEERCSDAGAVEFKGAKRPLNAYSWVDKMEMTFESTELPEEKKVKMAVSFLDNSAYHWWTLARRSNDGAQTMTWEQFRTLFLGQYFNHSHRSRIQSDF